jgi:hypothetical protein
MTTFHARLLDAETGSEGRYQFDAPEDLLRRTADEVVSTFFHAVEDQVLTQHIDWEVNGVLAQRDRGVVVAIGSLLPKAGAPMPFALVVSSRGQ